jgi:hypothetical protein
MARLLVVGSHDSMKRFAVGASTGANAWSLKEKVTETKEHLADQHLQDLTSRMQDQTVTPSIHPHLQAILTKGLNLSIYIPFPLGKFVARGGSSKAYVRGATPWKADSALPLKEVPKASGWLWIHSEYEMTAYMLERIKREMHVVPTVAEADICFLSCEQNISHLVQADACKGHQESTTAPSECSHFFFRGKPIMTDPHHPYLYHNQKLRFDIPVSKRNDWADCKELWLHFESMAAADRDEHDSCLVVVPYIHSIAMPTKHALSQAAQATSTPAASTTSTTSSTASTMTMTAPWELATNRTSLLFFVGGLARGLDIGVDRKAIADGLTQAAKELRPGDPKSIFHHHQNAFDVGELTGGDIVDSQEPSAVSDGTFERRQLGLLLGAAWEGYATSEFSWQPGGDTSTRRAFYVSTITSASARLSNDHDAVCDSIEYSATDSGSSRSSRSSLVLVIWLITENSLFPFLSLSP